MEVSIEESEAINSINLRLLIDWYQNYKPIIDNNPLLKKNAEIRFAMNNKGLIMEKLRYIGLYSKSFI